MLHHSHRILVILFSIAVAFEGYGLTVYSPRASSLSPTFRSRWWIPVSALAYLFIGGRMDFRSWQMDQQVSSFKARVFPLRGLGLPRRQGPRRRLLAFEGKDDVSPS